MAIKVSILIPCYNAEQWVAASIESALNQTYPNTEIVVIDDGSTDSSLDIIQSFGNKVIWRTQPNQGGNFTRNNLLDLATGEWVQFLDSDDYLKPEKIAHQVAVIEESNTHLDVVCSPALTEYHEDGGLRYEASAVLEPEDPWVLLAKWALPQTGGSLWRKEAITDVGGWDESMTCCQEHDLYSRLLIGDKKFGYLHQSEAIYRIWSTETVSRKNPLKPLKNRLMIKDRLEAHLLESDQMTPERQNTLNQARFDCARVLYSHEPDAAATVIQKIKVTEPNFIPQGNSSPKLYQILFKNFGFQAAETVAAFKRNLSSSKS